LEHPKSFEKLTILSQKPKRGRIYLITISDFINASGRPGYFQLQLKVYGHAGQPCKICGQIIQKATSQAEQHSGAINARNEQKSKGVRGQVLLKEMIK